MTVRGDIISTDTIRIADIALKDAGVMTFPFDAEDRATERTVECFSSDGRKVVKGGHTHYIFREKPAENDGLTIEAFAHDKMYRDGSFFGTMDGQVADGWTVINGTTWMVKAYRTRRIRHHQRRERRRDAERQDGRQHPRTCAA